MMRMVQTGQLETKGPMKGTHPAWSPDGTEIALLDGTRKIAPGYS